MKQATSTMWNEKKVLITGMNGFIGSHLARSLIENGAHVHGTSRSKSNYMYLTDRIFDKTIIHPMAIESFSDIEQVLKQEDFDVVFHLASQSDTWKSIQEPYTTMQTNVLGTLNVLEALRRMKNNASFVLAGSVRVFQQVSVPNEEVQLLHPYDASKMAADVLAMSYIRAYGMSGAIARNTNTYGENDLNFARLIPRIMKSALVDKKISLWGDGSLKRDFMHVSDAVHGMLLLAEKLPSLKAGAKEFTFATGKNHSVAEIVELVKTGLHSQNVKVEWVKSESMKDRDQPACDVSMAKKQLGWSPKVALPEGLLRTQEWYEKYFSSLRR